MKTTLLLLSAACCLALPAAVRADDTNNPPSKKTAIATAKAGKAAATTPAVGHKKMICYITDRPRTGSNIPMTYRQYNGQIDSASSPAVYGGEALRFTGSTDTAGILLRLDPSISIGGRR